MRSWDDIAYREDRELEERKASGLCTMCQTKVMLDYKDGEYSETVISFPKKATHRHMFMHLCEEHHKEVMTTVALICK